MKQHNKYLIKTKRNWIKLYVKPLNKKVKDLMLKEWFTYFDIPFFSLLYHWKTPIEYYITNKLFITFFQTAVNTSTCLFTKKSNFFLTSHGTIHQKVESPL